MGLNRRELFRIGLRASALLALNPARLLASLPAPGTDPQRLSFRSYRTATIEGSWRLSDIEGTVPAELQGEFIKIGPGTKEIFGRPLQHFFDGDAYVNRFRFHAGRVDLDARFLDTPFRSREQARGEMLFHEFGTPAPARTQQGRKNQPNINLVSWDGSLLALSEGAHPAVLNRETLAFEAFTDFKGTLPKNVSFTAHPKFDPATGFGYTYGIEQGVSRALKVYRMNPWSGELEELYSLNQSRVYMIHDMLMTADHLVFLIPPAFFKLTGVLFGDGALAHALDFDPRSPTRLLVLDKRGKERPIEVALPASLVFHHGNAHLEDGLLTLQTFLAPDGSMLDLIAGWRKEVLPPAALPDLHRITVDLKARKLLSDEVLLRAHDFPAFNQRCIGRPQRYLYAAGMGRAQDVMAFDRVTKCDLQSGTSSEITMPAGRVCGEPLFIPRPGGTAEDDGWLVFQGHDQTRDEAFLELRDGRDLRFTARVWAGRYLPLGFHGGFLSA